MKPTIVITTGRAVAVEALKKAGFRLVGRSRTSGVSTAILLPPRAQESELKLLTDRQLEVMACLAQGMTIRECAKQLGLSSNTVDNHATRVRAVLGLHNVVDLALLAIREGLIEA